MSQNDVVPSAQQRWERGARALESAIRAAIDSMPAVPVNFSTPRHSEIVLALHRLAYDPSLRSKQTLVVFSDGSRGVPVPLGTLDARRLKDNGSPAEVLTVGLMSFRHPEMDYLVDLYISRNADIASASLMAEEEQYSFARTFELLQEIDPHRGEVRLRALHTGLEPMVLGFYRAVITVLQARHARRAKGAIVVEPLLYIGPPERNSLSPESPGAKLENYLAGPLWR